MSTPHITSDFTFTDTCDYWMLTAPIAFDRMIKALKIQRGSVSFILNTDDKEQRGMSIVNILYLYYFSVGRLILIGSRSSDLILLLYVIKISKALFSL